MFPARNDAYQRHADFKNFGYVRVFDADGAHAADQENIVVTQLGLEGRGTKTTEPLSVPRILAEGAPFKIGNDVIRFYRIDMVDDRKVVGVRNECNRDDAVNEKSDRLSIPTESEGWISSRILRSQDFSSAALDMSVSMDDFATNASDTAKAADFIATFVSNDGSPFFCGDGIHVAGYLSGYDGLMIKDPLHASTFGGSAIMTAASDNCNGRLQFR